MQLDILMMATYITHFAARSGPQLQVMQYPEDASVLLNSTVWMLCVFEYPREENEEPVVYWRKGPDCHNQPSLQPSPSIDLKCKDCTTSDEKWWGWFLLLGYTIFVTTVIIAFGLAADVLSSTFTALGLAALALLVLLSLAVAVSAVTSGQRAAQGAYSPSRQEKDGARVEMWDMVQPPPMERLI